MKTLLLIISAFLSTSEGRNQLRSTHVLSNKVGSESNKAWKTIMTTAVDVDQGAYSPDKEADSSVSTSSEVIDPVLVGENGEVISEAKPVSNTSSAELSAAEDIAQEEWGPLEDEAGSPGDIPFDVEPPYPGINAVS
jgi:hypothetical protein